MIDDEGKVVWPIPEEGISYLDAGQPCSTSPKPAFGLSHYAENGNDMLGDLALSLFGPYNCYFQKPLKQASEEQLDEPSDFSILGRNGMHRLVSNTARRREKRQPRKIERLTVRLLRAYHEWETNEATWTLDELERAHCPR